MLTIGPQGAKVSRFAIESRLTESLFAQRPYIHVTRPLPAPPQPLRTRRPLEPKRRG